MLVLILCQALAQPVYSAVRGLEWTRIDLVRQAALSMGATVIPVLFIASGFRSLFQNGDVGGLLLSYAAAVLIFFLCSRGLRSFLQWRPNALTAGELRDRAFALAASLGVKLQQLYLLPAGKMRLANAFARQGNNIMLTDYLLTHLNKREVDFVIAHELAHLKRGHPQKLSFALLGGFALVMTASLLWRGANSLAPLFDILYLLVPLCVYYFFARRFEFIVDADATKLTNDPAAAVACLVKIHQLNLVPTQWGKVAETFLTHPSTVRRAESIARAAGIPREQIAPFLERALAPAVVREPEPAERYPLPSSFAGEGKVFSTQFKQMVHWRGYWGQYAALTLVPALSVWLIHAVDQTLPAPAIILSGLVVTVAMHISLLNILPLNGYGQLQRRLGEKFEREGVNPSELCGILVGFSPDSSPRIYELNYSWDTGFLFVLDGALCYWGEEARFVLRREQIVSIRLGQGIPSWVRPKNLYVTCLDQQEKPITFNIRQVGVRSLLQMKREVRVLAERLDAWRSSGSSSAELPKVFAELDPPSFRQVTSLVPGHGLKFRQVFLSFIGVGFLAGCAVSLLGLPVDVATPIAWLFHLVPPEGADPAGWYAVLVAWLTLFVSLFPGWLFREKPAAQPTATTSTTVESRS